MTDQTAGGFSRPRAKSLGAEYGVYYGLIYALSLPPALVMSTLALAGVGERVRGGMFGRAKETANRITPIIFSA